MFSRILYAKVGFYSNCVAITIAGGSAESDEVVEDAVKRELLEETGLIAEELELFSVFSGEDCHYVYPNGDEVSNTHV